MSYATETEQRITPTQDQLVEASSVTPPTPSPGAACRRSLATPLAPPNPLRAELDRRLAVEPTPPSPREVNPLTASTPLSGELSPADVAWLQRLPADLAEVPLANARTVVAMRRRLTETSDPGSRRLVESIAEPIERYHAERTAKANAAQERRQAEVEVRRLQDLKRNLPREDVSALAAEIGRQHPDLTELEAWGRAWSGCGRSWSGGWRRRGSGGTGRGWLCPSEAQGAPAPHRPAMYFSRSSSSRALVPLATRT